MLSVTTIVSGQYLMISFAAAIPFKRGISMSKIATSGQLLLAFSAASVPSLASALISKSVLSLSKNLIAILPSSLSSAIRILAATGSPLQNVSVETWRKCLNQNINNLLQYD